MKYEIKKENDFQYIEEGNGPVLLLLHGLFGALSNWMDVVEHFSGKYRIVIPLMRLKNQRDERFYRRISLYC